MNAVEALQTQGIPAEPDVYIPPVDEMESSEVQSAATHYSWGMTDCHFDSFVTSRTFTGSGVVAVVDTGVDASHPFLKGRVLGGRDFVDGDSDPSDQHYHGTHVAGTVIDCVGTAPVKILPVRVLNARGSGYNSTVVSGIKYAADQGADVINLSLGGNRASGSDVVDSAISYAVNKGGLAVIAAGNDSGDTSRYCPSHLTTPGTVIVSAGDSKHNRAYFTNFGQNVDLMAPGVSIKACTPGNSFKTLNGTSMAAPHAAAAAVLLDLVWGKSLTPAQLEAKVQSATTNGKWTDKYQGYGFLDMSKANLPSNNQNPVITSYRYSVSSLSLKEGETAKVTVSADYSDGTTKDVTSSAELYCTNTAVATADRNGTVKALKEGTARICLGTTPAASVSIPAPITVTVSKQAQPTVTGYRYNVSSLSLDVGQTASVKVTAIYSDGSTKDVTSSAKLYSTDTAVASVSSTGAVKGLTEGTARISIGSTPSGISIPAPITVTVKQPTGNNTYRRLFWVISSTGDTTVTLTMSKGSTLKIALYGETASGNTVDLTRQCEIYSGDTSVVTVGTDGTVRAVKAGSSYLWIKAAPHAGVDLPPLLEIEVTP